MEKSFVTFGIFGTFVGRKHRNQFIGYMQGIDHFIFCITRMHISSLNRDFGRSGIKIFVFQFANFAAIHRVSPCGTKLLDIEFVGTTSDLLIGRKTYTYLAVFDFWVSQKIFNRRNYFCNTGFIVCTE
jgi:hypothetical protein